MWYVITGGPFAGKTTLLEELRARGYSVQEETARTYIEQELQKGKTIDLIRKDEAVFQQAVFKEKMRGHAALSTQKTIFFDRGIPDSIAYMHANGVAPTSAMEEASKKFVYRKVFILDMVGYAIDHARIESPEVALRIQEALYDAYTELGMPVVRVPVMPLKERVEFILNNL